jgi:hypothetical protein
MLGMRRKLKAKAKKCLKVTICLHYLLAQMEPPHPHPGCVCLSKWAWLFALKTNI